MLNNLKGGLHEEIRIGRSFTAGGWICFWC
jgi:hypothetical protein